MRVRLKFSYPLINAVPCVGKANRDLKTFPGHFPCFLSLTTSSTLQMRQNLQRTSNALSTRAPATTHATNCSATRPTRSGARQAVSARSAASSRKISSSRKTTCSPFERLESESQPQRHHGIVIRKTVIILLLAHIRQVQRRDIKRVSDALNRWKSFSVLSISKIQLNVRQTILSGKYR